MISNFFHTPSSKKFYIPPRFHDPEADNRAVREEKIKSELGIYKENINNENYKVNIKGQFNRGRGGGGESSESETRSYRKRLYGLIFIISLFFIAILYMDKIIKFYDFFIK